MFPNISNKNAQLLKRKIQEVKEILDQDIFTYTLDKVSVTISVLGNIKEISNPNDKSIAEIIPIINEATTKAREEYEVKQAQLLQKEMMSFM